MDTPTSIQPQLFLQQDGLHPWVSFQSGARTTWARGSAWQGGRLLEAGTLAEALSSCFDKDLAESTCEQAADWLADCNGAFAVVVEEGGRLFAGVDRYRLRPLFYACTEQGLCIGDSAEKVAEAAGLYRIDPWDEKEFLLCGYVLGDRTLISGLKQILTAECVAFFGDGASGPSWRHRYYAYTGEEFACWDERKTADAYVDLIEDAFKRLIRQCADRPLAVPLSGGLDSRVVAVLLKNFGAKDVRCFSYGRPGNHDARISRRVAEKLGLPWHFVPYSRAKWRSWFNSEERRAYSRQGAQLCSSAHLQDFPAVWELRTSGAVPEDTVFLPGHGWQLELEYGSEYNEGHAFGSPSEEASLGTPEHYTRDDLIKLMLAKHFGIYNWKTEQAEITGHLGAYLNQLLGHRLNFTLKDMIDAIAVWNSIERQPKITYNSVRVYEFWNCDWALPLCDNVAADLYNQVPAVRKVHRRFLKQALIPRLLEPWGLDQALGRYNSRSIMALAVKADRRVKRASHYADLAYHLEYHLFGRFHDRCIHGMLPKKVYFDHVHALEPWKAGSLHLAACMHYLYREMMTEWTDNSERTVGAP